MVTPTSRCATSRPWLARRRQRLISPPTDGCGWPGSPAARSRSRARTIGARALRPRLRSRPSRRISTPARRAAAHRRRSHGTAVRLLRGVQGQGLQRHRLCRAIDRRRRQLLSPARADRRSGEPALRDHRARSRRRRVRGLARQAQRGRGARRRPGLCRRGAGVRLARRRRRHHHERAHRPGRDLRMLPARRRLRRSGPAGGAVPQRVRRQGARSRDHDLRRSRNPGPDLSRQHRRLGDRRLPACRAKPGDRAERQLSRGLVHRRPGPPGPVLPRARPTAAAASPRR